MLTTGAMQTYTKPQCFIFFLILYNYCSTASDSKMKICTDERFRAATKIVVQKIIWTAALSLSLSLSSAKSVCVGGVKTQCRHFEINGNGN